MNGCSIPRRIRLGGRPKRRTKEKDEGVDTLVFLHTGGVLVIHMRAMALGRLGARNRTGFGWVSVWFGLVWSSVSGVGCLSWGRETLLL